MRAPGTWFERGDICNELIAGSGFGATEAGLRLHHERIDIFNTFCERGRVGKQALQPEQSTVLNFDLNAVRHAEQIILHPEGRERRSFHAMKELLATGVRRCIATIDFSSAAADNFVRVRTGEVMACERCTERAPVLFHQ